MKKHEHIIVGISGGVDSSVAAALLKKEGHKVTGVFMKNWEGDDEHCPATQDLADAESVCEKLGIPLQLVNFSNEYWERVFSFFLDEYRAGRTPNPDILCNKEIKFKAFLDYAKQQGADKIATGHYARRSESDINTQLLKGLDHNKDQSYFLHALTSDVLAQVYFPVGELEKTKVRTIAAELGLKTHDKKDSTGICFIGERKFKTFLNEYLPAQPGDICTLDGKVIGSHDGLMFYTIGQRQGLQIGGLRGVAELPWYVAEKRIDCNKLIVVQGEDHPALFKSSLIGLNPHWINEPHPFKEPPPRPSPSLKNRLREGAHPCTLTKPKEQALEGAHPCTLTKPKEQAFEGAHLCTLPLRVMAKTRYRQPDQACVIEAIPNSPHIKVTFDAPQRAITPGQSVVFYQGEVCLGGAIIA